MRIYLISSTATPKQYVGQTIKNLEKRLAEHKNAARLGSTQRIHEAMRCFPDTFSIEELANLKPEYKTHYVLDRAERLLIVAFGTLAPNGYNTSPGGEVRSRESCRRGGIIGGRKSKESGWIAALGRLQGPKNKEVGRAQGLKNIENGHLARMRAKENWVEGCRQGGRTQGRIAAESGQIAALSEMGLHTRWHVNRKIVKEDCVLCAEFLVQLA